MDSWLKAIEDNPDLNEGELIKQLWKGNNAQPVTSEPIITNNNGKVTVSCDTEGASIGFKVVKSGEKAPKSWDVYQNPIELLKGEKILAKAHRIGFKSSQTVQFQ
jgi:hypothetical protein